MVINNAATTIQHTHTPDTNLVPAQGAYGYSLGAALPESITTKVDSNPPYASFNFEHDENIPDGDTGDGFITIILTEDRKIAEIDIDDYQFKRQNPF